MQQSLKRQSIDMKMKAPQLDGLTADANGQALTKMPKIAKPGLSL